MRTRTAFIALLILAAAARTAPAKSFVIDRLHSDVTVYRDGSARVVEQLTYSFNGSYTWAFRSIPLREGDRIDDISVFEGDRLYADSSSKAPGTFAVQRRDDEVVIRWYYQAEDESRTFRIEYTVRGMVTRHPDAGDVYYTLFENHTGAPVGEVSTRVTLPGDLSAADMKVFAHGPPNGTVSIAGPSTVEARIAPLPAGTLFDVRIITPEEVFSLMHRLGRPARKEILAQEARWAREANRRREAEMKRRERLDAERRRRDALTRTLLPVSVVLAVLSLAMWFAYYRRYGWPHHVSAHAVPGQVPSDHPPALVAYLASRGVSGQALVATLVDLSERGHLSITETPREAHGWFGSSKTKTDYRFDRQKGRDELRDFERGLLDFACDEAGDGRSFTMAGFKSYASKHRSSVRRWFRGWSKQVKEAGRKEGFFEPYVAGAVVPNVIAGIAVAAAGVAISAVTSSPAGIPAIAAGLLQAILTSLFTRRTPEGQRLLVAWSDFRKHLVSVSRAMGKVSLTSSEWSRFLAVAIIFGLHEKVLPSLSIEGSAAHGAYPVWYTAMSGGQGASMAAGLSSMVSSVSTTMSSSTGAGGGASAGGGGGAGGGSAGAG